MPKQKSIVLLSAGLDSTVNFYESIQTFNTVLALTFDYGQRAAPNEIATAKKICELYGVHHQVIQLPWLQEVSKSSSLTNSEKEIPTDSVNITSLAASNESAKSVWVSNRNGLFLNIAACFAEQLAADKIIVGFNKEEAATFPDNSADFITAANRALSYSTQNKVQVESFTIAMNKKQIVQHGRSLGADFDLMWPCYFSGETICGQCESCKRFLAALT